MIVRFIDFCRERMKLVVGLSYAVLALLVVIDIADLFMHFMHKEHHAHTWMEKIPGWWSFYGFVACVLIIFVSKWFGHLGIMTREDYYD